MFLLKEKLLIQLKYQKKLEVIQKNKSAHNKMWGVMNQLEFIQLLYLNYTITCRKFYELQGIRARIIDMK